MDWVLAALEATGPAQFLRISRWGYAGVSATHIFGLALLVGAILPLDLRLLGAWRGVPRENLVRVLVPVAIAGFLIAAISGGFLFSVRAREYADISFFQLKVVFAALGILAAIILHAAHGFLLKDAGRGRLAVHALISMTCWIGALACGRLIAFAGD